MEHMIQELSGVVDKIDDICGCIQICQITCDCLQRY
jgi:hypothetical protein